MTQYSADLVANAILYRAKKKEWSISHLKLQKLMYFVHGWSLTFHCRSYVNEPIQAWEHGPVFASLYDKLKGYRSKPVSYITQIDPETGKSKAMMPSEQDIAFWHFLNKVLDRYGPMDGLVLSALAHEDGSPWWSARQRCSAVVDNVEMAQYFREKLKAINHNA